MTETRPEAWLRGPVADVPALLQPVAHALVQAADEVEVLLDGVSNETLWARPQGVASAGFHVQHMRGVVDRLFTYARGEALSARQQAELAAEGTRPDPDVSAGELVKALCDQIQQALEQLRTTDEGTLGNARAVGRKQLPSTVQGLLFHAAEHVQRHVGQLLVTVRVQSSSEAPTTEFPRSIGKVAARELALSGYTRFAQLTHVSRESLLAIHGVGPKAVNILEEELKQRGLRYGSS